MRWEAYLLATVVILILGSVVLITHQSSPGFSVVYFDNSTVPDYLSPGNNTTIIFIIESHENAETTYSFTVSLNGTQVEKGSLSLAPEERGQVPVKISVENITYEKVVLWNKTTVYNVTGALNITGGCVALNSTTQLCEYLPAAYKGPSDLNFILNTQGNVSVTEVSTNSTNTGRISTRYALKILRMGDEVYRVIVQKTRIMYSPRNVFLEITVRSSTGKVYQLSRSFPVVSG